MTFSVSWIWSAGDGQQDNVRSFHRGGQIVFDPFNRPDFFGRLGDLGTLVMADRGDLVLVVGEGQPDRGTDLPQSDDGDLDSH
jgi:hypothetical protein